MKTKTIKKPRALRPVDGEFRHTKATRRAWCAENGHLLAILNLSRSTAACEVRRCMCGEREESGPPAA